GPFERSRRIFLSVPAELIPGEFELSRRPTLRIVEERQRVGQPFDCIRIAESVLSCSQLGEYFGPLLNRERFLEASAQIHSGAFGRTLGGGAAPGLAQNRRRPIRRPRRPLEHVGGGGVPCRGRAGGERRW